MCLVGEGLLCAAQYKISRVSSSHNRERAYRVSSLEGFAERHPGTTCFCWPSWLALTRNQLHRTRRRTHHLVGTTAECSAEKTFRRESDHSKSRGVKGAWVLDSLLRATDENPIGRSGGCTSLSVVTARDEKGRPRRRRARGLLPSGMIGSWNETSGSEN